MDADGVAMGPRHICMHPSGRYAYVNNEIGSAVTPVKIDAETGGMSIAGPSLSSTPDDWTAASVAAKTTCMFTDRPALISHCAPRHSRTLNPHTTTRHPAAGSVLTQPAGLRQARTLRFTRPGAGSTAPTVAMIA